MKKILVLSKDSDLHVQPVIEQIKSVGAFPVLLDLEKDGEEFFVTVDASNIAISNGSDTLVNLGDVSAVWYRRPVFKTGGKDLKVQWQKDFSEGEERETWDGLWLVLKNNLFFLNHPFSNRIAGNKIFQLNVASKIGFQIPNFIVTNKPTDVKSFVENHRKVIYKTLHQPKKVNSVEDLHVFFTNIIEEKHLNNLNRVSVTPCLFQEYIEKTYEVRVTIVGGKVFAARILSQKSLEAGIDWRRDPSALTYEIESLPQDISEKCLKLVRFLNLSFGAIDLIFNKDLGYIFLEINPNGQWLWIEKKLRLPISEAIASVLVRGGD